MAKKTRGEKSRGIVPIKAVYRNRIRFALDLPHGPDFSLWNHANPPQDRLEFPVWGHFLFILCRIKKNSKGSWIRIRS